MISRTRDADKAGAFQLTAEVFGATDSEMYTRDIARREWLYRSPRVRAKRVDEAEAWLRKQLGAHMPNPGEVYIWGRVTLGCWTPTSWDDEEYGFVEDAEYDTYDGPGAVDIYATRRADGEIVVTRD